jgi:multisubunit Na+/H+ antiporter MnhE subunit
VHPDFVQRQKIRIKVRTFQPSPKSSTNGKYITRNKTQLKGDIALSIYAWCITGMPLLLWIKYKKYLIIDYG